MSPPARNCLLLVEDDTLVRDTVAMMLSDEGFTVTEASNAADALRLLAEGLPATVIVTDVDLGGGASGVDLADELHRVRPDLRVIFITGRTASLQGRDLDSREAVLSKPFATSDLSRLVRRMGGPLQ